MNNRKWTTHKELKLNLMKDPEFVKEYNKLEAKFQIAKQMMDARIKQNISQEELAKKVKTGQAVISRLEGASGKPSISLLERVARALNIKFNITIQ